MSASMGVGWAWCSAFPTLHVLRDGGCGGWTSQNPAAGSYVLRTTAQQTGLQPVANAAAWASGPQQTMAVCGARADCTVHTQHLPRGPWPRPPARPCPRQQRPAPRRAWPAAPPGRPASPCKQARQASDAAKGPNPPQQALHAAPTHALAFACVCVGGGRGGVVDARPHAPGHREDDHCPRMLLHASALTISRHAYSKAHADRRPPPVSTPRPACSRAS